MPRQRPSSSESSSDDSSEESDHKKGHRRKQHVSQSKKRRRNDSSDSSPEEKNVKPKTRMSQKSNRRSPEDRRRKDSDSEDSDYSPVKGGKDRGRRPASKDRNSIHRKNNDRTSERKGEGKSRQSDRDGKRHSTDRERSSSRNRDRSPYRRKQSGRDHSPARKRDRHKSSPDHRESEKEAEEVSSPSKPILASRANYMKSLNPDRSKIVVKKLSPSRRKVASLADDLRQARSTRRGVESLADDYRRGRDWDSGRGDKRDERRDRDQKSPKRRLQRRGSRDSRSVEKERSPRASQQRRSRDRSFEQQRSPVRQSQEMSPRRRRSPGRNSPSAKSFERQRSPIRSHEKQKRQDRSPEIQRLPVRRSHEKQRQQDRSPEIHRSPVRRSREKQRQQDSSPEIQRSPVRRSREKQRQPDRSPEIQSSPVRRSREKQRHQERLPDIQRTPVKRSLDRKRSPVGRSEERERSPVSHYQDRQSSLASRSQERQEQLSPMKRDFRRPPPERMQRRQSLESRSPPRFLEDTIPQDREFIRQSPVRRLPGRPVSRRRSEERIPSRLSPEMSYDQLAVFSRKSSGLSPVHPLERRRSAERPFAGRRSLERGLDQRYPLLSPPRILEQRTRARSLERVSQRRENDRYFRGSGSQRQMQAGMFNRYRRDSDRGLYDDIPDPLDSRLPPPERRWRDQTEYLDRYRDDMDLPQRSVYVDRDVSIRVRNDRARDAERVSGWRDQKRNRTFSTEEDFQGRISRSDGSFDGFEDRNWQGMRNSRSSDLLRTQADDSSRHLERTGHPKRRRSNSDQSRGSSSPKRNKKWQGNERENSRSLSPIHPDLQRIRENRKLRQMQMQMSVDSVRSTSPVGHDLQRIREKRNAEKRRSSSESEESPTQVSKLSSTVTMVSKGHKRSKSPGLKSPGSKTGSSVSEHKTKSNRGHSESPQRTEREEADLLSPVEDDRNTRLHKKRSRSPGKSTGDRMDIDMQEYDRSASRKKQSRSPDKSSRDRMDRDRKISDKKSSRSPGRLDSRTSEPQTERSVNRAESPRERIDSVTSEQNQEFSRIQEMERMDSITSEQDYSRSHERERFDSTNSEQDLTRSEMDVSSDVPVKRKHDMERYESEPESGELTDSEEEIEKRNALIKSLVNKPSFEELSPDEAERQRIEDERYLAEKRLQALARMEAGKETVTSHVVKVTDNRREDSKRDRGGRDDRREGRREREREEITERTDSKRQRLSEEPSGRMPEASQSEAELPAKKAKADPTGVEALTMRTGGAYIPPAKLRAMQESITDKSSIAYQRMSWEALKKSINGLINKVNVSNIEFIVRELFQENIVRGRGLMARSIIQAQAASPTFTHVYAALVAIVNTKFPQNGELILRRLVIQFRRGFKRNDKSMCLSTTRFVAHLVNQQVAHEVLALEILTLLLETPTDDSVEISVGFLKECGQKLTEVTPRGVNAIFERLRNVLHEGTIDIRVQYMVEVMFAVRKDGFKDHPSVLEDLDLVEEEDQFTHLLTLEDAGDPENLLNVFKADPDFLENEEKYKILKKEILDEGSSDEEGGSASGSESDDSEENEEGGEKEAIIDNTETNLVALRRTIYLTIQSSLDFEECAHKLMKMELKPGQESELCYMVLDCCAQMRTYEKFFGLLAQRFCMIDKKYIEPFQTMFKEQYDTIHRLETNKLRNVAKFFAHLLHTDAISWGVLTCIKLNEEDTSSASRIFIKILMQELSEYMGLPNLNERLKDPTLQEYFEGLLPRDNPRNTRFAINFFTTIGLGGLTDDLRDHLKNVSKKLMEQKQQEQEAADISSSSESESSASESSSESESSDSSDEDRRKKGRKKGEKGKQKEKSKKDKREKRGKKAVSNGAEKSGKKSRKGKSNNSQDEAAQSRAERLRRLAEYDAGSEPVDVRSSRGRADMEDEERDMDMDMGRNRKKTSSDRGMRNRDSGKGDNFDRPRDVSRGREFRERGKQNVEMRNVSDDERYRDVEPRPRDFRNFERQMSYDDGDNDRHPRMDRNFDKGDRFANRYRDLDDTHARENNNFGEGYNRRGKNQNQFRNDDMRGQRRQKFDMNAFGDRNNRGRNRNDRRMDRDSGRNRSEERTSHVGRDDRRRRR